MTEEEIKQKFKETYPDLMRGDEPLSPYFDIWCYAIEIMEQENNKLLDVINGQDVKIADLEKMLSEQYPDLKQSLDWANEREKENVERLEKANAIITEIKTWYLNTDICSERMPKELILKIDEWLKE